MGGIIYFFLKTHCCHWAEICCQNSWSEVPVIFNKNLADLSVNSTYCF